MRIALVGPMGVGKSTVGQILGEQLGVPCVDLDRWIETTVGRSIPEIFQAEGEAGFRLMELNALREVTQSIPSCILACGGGVVTTNDCRLLLMHDWLTVSLTAQVETLMRHLEQNSQGRPLLNQGGNLRERVESLYEERKTWYHLVSKVSFSVDGKSIIEIVSDIVQWLTSNGRFEPERA
jgi:shikimate kinase